MTLAVDAALSRAPSHWDLFRLKAAVSRLEVRNTDLRAPMMSLRSDGTIVSRSSLGKRQEPADGSLPRYLVVQPGDLVVNPMWLTGGAIGVSAVYGAVSPDYRVFRPRPLFESRYLHHLLRSKPYVDQYKLFTRADTTFDRRVQQDDLDNLPLPAPPLSEQRAIADYLDRETVQVDALIGKQERLIETLRERRAAMVERTVFAGLNASVGFSRNEHKWLPSHSPAHWIVTQLGFRTQTLAGYAFPSDGFREDSTMTRLLRGINIKPGRLVWDETVYWDETADGAPEAFRLAEGDLVLGMDRPFVSSGVRIAPVSKDDLPALLLQRVLRLRCDDMGDQRYLARLVSTRAFLSYLEPLFTGVSVPHMSEWQVRKFRTPFPPLDEQRQIATYLDEQTAKIDALITTAERFIEVSKERRSALITAAVTGQIDVQDRYVASGARSVASSTLPEQETYA